MDFPELTPEKRAKAWAKATAIRQARGDLLAAVKAGELPIADVLARAETDTIVSKTRVSVLVKALPGVDAVRAAHILGGLSIADAQRIGGLGPNQRQTLLDLASCSSPGDATPKVRPTPPAAAALDRSTLAAAIPEFLEGLAPGTQYESSGGRIGPRMPLDRRAGHQKFMFSSGSGRHRRSRWSTFARTRSIRAATPQYKIVDTHRLRAVNAVGAMMIDSDPTGTLDETSNSRDIVIPCHNCRSRWCPGVRQ
jgi:hypothetical protein